MTMRKAVLIGIERFGGTAPAADPEMPSDDEWPSLDMAAARVKALAATLTRFDYDCVIPEDTRQLRAADLAGQFWAAANGLDRDDLLVLHVLSHGKVENDTLYVIGSDGKHHTLSDVSTWLRKITDFPGSPRTLFLLDLCSAGTAARLDWQAATADGSSRVWVIAACAPDTKAFNGRFTEALVNVLGRYADNDGDVHATRSHIPLELIGRSVRREVARLATEQRALPQLVTGSLLDITADQPDLPFFVNSGHTTDSRSLARANVDVTTTPFLDDVDESLDAEFFMERASGYQTGGVGCFSGRKDELKILSDFFNGWGNASLRVVTGSPGAGKSALVGVLVCAAHPILREPTRKIWRKAEWAPGECRDFAAVHARQRTADEVLAAIGRQLAIEPRGSEHWHVEDFLEQLAARTEAPLIVVDALDEASQPREVLARILMPLATLVRADRRAGCRLLVAMRPWEEFGSLRELAQRGGGLVDLDTVKQDVLRYDLYRYVDDLLACQPPYDDSEYTGPRASFADGVARALTAHRARGSEQRWGEFLVAGLYTHHLVTSRDPIADSREAAALGRAVPVTLPELLEVDLAARTHIRWLRPVLATLAHARGQGMSLETVRNAVVAFAPGESVPGPSAITAAIRAARFYLRHAADVDGTTQFRLFHQGLADYLRKHHQGRDATDEADAVTARRLTAALLAPIDGPERRWDEAEPYLLRNLVQHALDGECPELLAEDPEFFVYADPEAVTALLEKHEPAWLTAADWATLFPATDGSRLSRRYALARHALRSGAAVRSRLAARLRWQPAWTVRPSEITEDADLVLSPTPASAILVARVRRRPYAIVATRSGTLAVWQLAEHRRSWTVQVTPPVTRISVRGTTLVTHDAFGTARAYDIRSGTPVAGIPDVPEVPAVATERGPMLIVASPQGGVRLFWDEPEPVPCGLFDTAQPVTALDATAGMGVVHITTVEGDSIVVTTWSVRKHRVTRRETIGYASGIHSVSAVRWNNSHVVVTSGADVRAWMATSRPTRRATPHTLTVWPEFAAIGTDAGTIIVHDTASGELVTRIPQAHDSPVSCLRLASVAGRTVVASASSTGDLAVWDVSTGECMLYHPTEAVAAPWSIGVTELGGRLVVIAYGNDGSTRMTSNDVALAGPRAEERAGRTGLPITDRGLVVEADRLGFLHILDTWSGRRVETITIGAPLSQVNSTHDEQILLRLADNDVVLYQPKGLR
ncbi:caspase family protein [Actinoplanes sp. CA-015351]|uniref:caspase family protein n=1 Tax=Actinoplanes sp. CA-015351 TaxID=3239897 RepID=UPI003D960BED